MKTPTIEDVFEKIREAAGPLKPDPKPTYKPLSELAGDRESCEKIFQFLTHQGRFRSIEPGSNRLIITGFDTWFDNVERWAKITIYHDGAYVMLNNDPVDNIFKTVKFIQSLGYSP